MVKFNPVRPVSREEGLEMRHQREEADAEQRRLQTQLADVEYRVDLEPHMDPVARVGFNAGAARPIFRPSNAAGIYIPLDGSQPPTEQMDRASRRPVTPGSVMSFGDYVGDSGVIAHEFRHRGFDLIRRTLPREEMVERYGEEAATLYFDTDEETLNDMMDRFDPHGDLAHSKPAGLTDSSKGMSEWDAERHRAVLNETALGVLEGRGSPPPAERREARTYLLGLIDAGYKSRDDSLANIESRNNNGDQ